MSTTGGASGSPRSTTLTFKPERSRGKLTRYAGSPAGNISPGLRLSRRCDLIIGSNQFNFPAEKLSDETDAKGYISPLRFRANPVIERKCRPRPGVRSGRALQSFVRMPNSRAVAVVDEPLKQFHPAFVAAQEVETSHCLEPDKREGYVGLDRVTVRQHVAHD